jgi:hypothetical protein
MKHGRGNMSAPSIHYLVISVFPCGGTEVRGGYDRETLLADLIGGQFEYPHRIVALRTTDLETSDVTATVCQSVVDQAMAEPGEWLCGDVIRMCELAGVDVPDRLYRRAA